MLKKIKQPILLFLSAVVIVLSISIPYTRYMTRQVQRESSQHLEELFTQVNRVFQDVVSRTWKYMDGWKEYVLEHCKDGEGRRLLGEYISRQKEVWGFHDFYFLDKDGNYLTLSGETGYFDLGDSLFELMNDGRNIVINSTLSTGSPVFLFAVPVPETEGEDITFRALAVSYRQNTLVDLLQINSSDYDADCYIVSPNGGIAMSSRKDEDEPVFNYFAYLSENAKFLRGSLDRLKSDIKTGDAGVAEIRVNRTDYYLTYLPVGLEDWTMLGVVAKDIVNANMNGLQHVTMAVMAVLFLVLSLLIISLLLQKSRRVIRGKDIELKYRDQLFGLLSTSVDDVFVMFGKDSRTAEYVSPNVERLLGITEEAVRRDVYVLEDSLEKKGSLMDGIDRIGIGDSRRADGYRINRRTGEWRWYSTTVYHELVDGSEKYIMVLSDRTGEKRNDERLLQALDVAQNANAAKSSFLSNMSHDIRTPLNGIIGMTAIARSSLSSRERVADCLDKIAFSSRHLLGLINDILDMSKIESGKMTLHYEPFSIEQLVEGVMEIIRPQAAVKEQELTTRIMVRRGEVQGDILRLNQVLLNLLSNAVKYTQNGGHILFQVEELEKAPANHAGFRFTVKDDGQGMSEEFLKTIFEPFSREKTSAVARTQGTGLGMSICKGIVDLLGGVIRAESRKGEGSTFTVELSLRLADGTARASEEHAAEKAVFDYRGRRFLVVEDNELNAEIICELLNMNGADTVLAQNGQEALEAFSQADPGTYDAVLMDVQMPVMNGYDSARAIRALERPDATAVPIIAMTADAFAEDIERAKAAGMNAHVAKPLEMEVLSAALEQVFAAE